MAEQVISCLSRCNMRGGATLGKCKTLLSGELARPLVNNIVHFLFSKKQLAAAPLMHGSSSAHFVVCLGGMFTFAFCCVLCVWENHRVATYIISVPHPHQSLDSVQWMWWERLIKLESGPWHFFSHHCWHFLVWRSMHRHKAFHWLVRREQTI